MLLLHCVRRAASRADWTAGISSEIKIPMIVMTTSNSTRVNCAAEQAPTDHYVKRPQRISKVQRTSPPMALLAPDPILTVHAGKCSIWARRFLVTKPCSVGLGGNAQDSVNRCRPPNASNTSGSIC